MEYISNLTLRQYLKQQKQKKVEENECRVIFKQLVSAVNYLHKQNIIHRDIKLENVIKSKEQQIKLIDFGFAVQMKDDPFIKIFCGTPCYMSPEMVNRQLYKGKPVDCWALGVLLYTLLVGNFPFRNNQTFNMTTQQQEKALFRKISQNNLQLPNYLDQGVVSLIKGILNSDPSQRYTTQQILDHSWLNK